MAFTSCSHTRGTPALAVRNASSSGHASAAGPLTAAELRLERWPKGDNALKSAEEDEDDDAAAASDAAAVVGMDTPSALDVMALMAAAWRKKSVGGAVVEAPADCCGAR